jgi:hypothetical protein
LVVARKETKKKKEANIQQKQTVAHLFYTWLSRCSGTNRHFLGFCDSKTTLLFFFLLQGDQKEILDKESLDRTIRTLFYSSQLISLRLPLPFANFWRSHQTTAPSIL